MLKKLLVPVVAVLLVLLTACGEAPSPEPSSSELSEPVFESFSSSSSSSSLSSPEEELSPEEKLLNLLQYQIYLYEKGNDGLPIDYEGRNSDKWLFAAVYSDEIGATEDDSGRRQPLIRLMYDRWLGVKYNGYFSYISPANVRLELDVKEYELTEDSAKITVSRIHDGVELFDAEYVFIREKADEEMLASDAAGLILDGYYWRYESVTPLEYDTEYETVIISTAEELYDLCLRVNARNPEAVNGKFELGCDIDMTGYSWQPMGQKLYREDFSTSYVYAKARGGFNGEFDGAGHTVSGISVLDTRSEAEVGFFGRIGSEAYVHDLTVSGSVSDGGNKQPTHIGRVGGFAGAISFGATVENCHFIGSVDGYAYVGGFAGLIGANYSTIGGNDIPINVTGCSADVTMIANSYGGGFAGFIYGGISNCEAVGTLKIVDKGYLPMNIGGFAGGLSCGVSGCKSAVYVETDLKDPNCMGNFAGDLSLKANIENCVVDTDSLHKGWRLIGETYYKGCVIDITEEDWYANAPGNEDS